MNPENFDDGVTHVAKSFKAEMTNTQKLERLKEIEELLEIGKKQNKLNSSFNKRLKQEANKIGEEFKNGCGKALWVEDNYGYTPRCGTDGYLCPTCQEANEILARINNV